MTEIMVSPKTLDIQLVTAGAKEVGSRRNAIPPTFVKNAATDWYRFDFDGLRHKHGGQLKRLESISLSCLQWEQHKLTQSQLLVTQMSCNLRQFTWPSPELLAQCAKTAI